MIPGVTPMPNSQTRDNTIAVALSHFPAVLSQGKLGTHNIYPDSDGIARQYRIYHDDYGWKLPSLPLRITQEFGYASDTPRDILINWRGLPFSCHTVSFSEIYQDTLKKVKLRPQNEFTDKIVIIGSTAPSLFDIKATPMAKLHPGVEIFATAIDNIKHNDYLRVPTTWLPYFLIALTILWATAFGFYRNLDKDRLAKIYGVSQFGLILLSYGSINFSPYYINLSGPVTLGLIYFSMAKLYAITTEKLLDSNLLTQSLGNAQIHGATIAVIRFHSSSAVIAPAIIRKMAKKIKHLSTERKDVEFIVGSQTGIWELLQSCLVITWTYASDDTTEK